MDRKVNRELMSSVLDYLSEHRQQIIKWSLIAIGLAIFWPIVLVVWIFKRIASKSHCPYCKSKNTNVETAGQAFMGHAGRGSTKLVAGLIFLPLIFFVGRKPKTAGAPSGECFDCGKKWRR